jgi:hypothetical protein
MKKPLQHRKRENSTKYEVSSFWEDLSLQSCYKENYEIK